MKKRNILITIGILLFVFLIIIFSYKKVMFTYEYPEEMPSDFDFVAKVESSEYVIDTYNNTFSKSLNWDKDTIIHYNISDNEKKRIYNLVKENDIIKYPNYFAPPTHYKIMPSFDYYFKCTFNSINVEINWEYNTESEDKEAKQLRGFIHSIFDNILIEEQIENLPNSERISM